MIINNSKPFHHQEARSFNNNKLEMIFKCKEAFWNAKVMVVVHYLKDQLQDSREEVA